MFCYGLYVQTQISAALNTKPTLFGFMYQGLASFLIGLASWLQLASESLPISQLSIVAWIMFALSGSFTRNNPFKSPER